MKTKHCHNNNAKNPILRRIKLYSAISTKFLIHLKHITRLYNLTHQFRTLKECTK